MRNQFGGERTIIKLDILYRYLNAYTRALKKQRFKKIYVEGFAGEGSVLLKDGRSIDGSARVALNIEIPFDEYYFIELNEEKVLKLKQIKDENSDKKITIISGDANNSLNRLIDEIDWRNYRGVFFIDPFATQTKRETLEKIANTKCADVWFLFPYYAVNRMLARDKDKTEQFTLSLNKCFGNDEWKKTLYKEKKIVQMSLFENESYETILRK